MGQQLHRCRDRARTRGYPDISRVSRWCRHRLNGDHCRRDAGGRFDIRDPGGKVWTLRRDNKVNSVSVDGRIDSNSLTALIGGAIRGVGQLLAPRWVVEEHFKRGKLGIILADYEVDPSENET